VECDTEELERLILFAQSVPSASQIPCVDGLPVGWEIREIETRTGEAVIHFSDDATDVESAAVFRASCGIGPDGALSGVLLERNRPSAREHAFLFAGGCVAIEFEDDVGAETVDELLGLISFISRSELRALSGWEL
jgi:hypothetical protein